MSKNRFYTIMLIPEKTDKVRKIIIPSLVFKVSIAFFVFLSVLAVIMILDYANVMNQITENKKLKVENYELKEKVQIFKDKITTIDSTLDRIKTFTTKLRIITNIDETTNSSLMPKTPDFDETIPNNQKSDDDQSFNQYNLDQSNEMPTQLSPETSKPRKRLSELLNTNNFAPFVIKSEFEKLEASFQEVNQFAQEVEKEVAFILDKISDKKAIIAGTPTRLPTYGYISSPYGVRVNPYEGQRKMHEGIDIANRFGAPVFAPAFGVVSFAGNKVGYGKLVILDHGNGLETYFAHLSKYTVQIGQRIKRGQIIGSVGNSGHSTGAHLHYEVRANGLPVDPCWYILDASNVCRGRN